MLSNLFRERELDIRQRGDSHMVYDRNNNVVKLKLANIWRNRDGMYAKPKSYKSLSCIIL